MSSEAERLKENRRAEIEDAVVRALDAGFTKDEIRDEVEYVLENLDPEDER